MMKLSKGVLGLKFMRKTRERIVKEDTEKKHREHSKIEPESKPIIPILPSSSSCSSSTPIKTEIGTQSQEQKSTECKVIVCPSYLHCERFNYPRQSYGGMNPTVEENVRKGDWTMEYEIQFDDEVQAKEEEDIKFKVEKDDPMEDGEISSMDSEEEDKKASEGPVFGSIIATIGRKFNRNAKQHQNKMDHNKQNKKRNMKRPHEDPQDRHDEGTMSNKKRKKGFWRKNKQKNKN